MSAVTAGVNGRPPREAAADEVRSYHGQPVLKPAVWSWEIPCYFYIGGMAGTSAGLAYLSELRGDRVIARRAWAIALLGIGASPVLLTSDLGRPARFLNMLRMVKPTSPMSVGSWILVGFGGGTSLAAANSLAGWFPRLSRPGRPAAAVLGLPLSTYTAALLANTAVPAWHDARLTLPFVFASGAALSAGAAVAIATPVAAAGPARRLALAGAACELGAVAAMRSRLGPAGEPYTRGQAARFGRVARVCIGAGATLMRTRGGRSRTAAIAAGALLSAGALSVRWSIFQAGIESAADPRYVIGPQRARIRSGARAGAARSEPRVAAADPSIGSPATSGDRGAE